VRHGQYAIEPVLRAKRPDLGRHCGHEQQVPVRQHHALGKAGCPRGVNQRGDTVGNVGIDGFGHDVLIQRADRERSQSGSLIVGRTMPFGVFTGVVGDARGVDQPASATVVADRIDFAGRKTCID